MIDSIKQLLQQEAFRQSFCILAKHNTATWEFYKETICCYLSPTPARHARLLN